MNVFVQMAIEQAGIQMKNIFNQLNSKIQTGCLVLMLAAISGCGGGGSGVPPVPVVASTNTFKFQIAWQKYVSNQYSKSMNVSGSCSGTLNYFHTAISEPKSFYYSDLSFPHPPGNVNPGYYRISNEEVISNLPGCVTSTAKTSTTLYYDAATFAPWGFFGGTAYNGETSYKGYFREFGPGVVLPTTVKVGDSGSVGTVYTYNMANFKKSGSPVGKTDVTYTIEADTASTAIVNIISKVYDSNNKLTLVDQTKYVIDSGDNLSLHMIDQQYSDTLTLHLIAQ